MRSIFYSRCSAVVATVVLFLSGATSAATLAPQEAYDLTNGKGLKGLSGFEGTDIVSVIKAYDGLKPKDAFETTAAFKARRTKEVAAAANPLQ